MAYYEPDLVLETEHLILRALRRDDAAAIYRNINHDRDVLQFYVAPYMENESEASVESSVKYAEVAGVYVFAIVLKETGEVIGMINQCSKMNTYFRNVEIGYAIGKPYWNNGYCTEALKKVIELLFAKGVHKVICQHAVENVASGRVMQKAGMTFEGLKKDELFYLGRYWDVNSYYMINDKETGDEV